MHSYPDSLYCAHWTSREHQLHQLPSQVQSISSEISGKRASIKALNKLFGRFQPALLKRCIPLPTLQTES